MADATTSSVKTFAAIMPDAIDRENGVIKGVSICTQGAAKGHGEFIDRECLTKLKELIQGFDNGVKVKVDHWSGFNGIVGSIRNPRFSSDRKKLLGDLHLLKKHEAYEAIIELAEEMPDQFGLSIAFSGMPEMKDNMPYSRPSELYSVDLVDQPAANPGGLFSSESQPKKPMSETPATPPAPAVDPNAAVLAAINEMKTQFGALETKVNALSVKPAEPAPAPAAPATPMNTEQIVQLAVKSALAANNAAPHTQPALAPSAPAAPSAPPAPEKKGFAAIQAETFDALVKQGVNLMEAKRQSVDYARHVDPEGHEAMFGKGRGVAHLGQPARFQFRFANTNTN